MNSKVKTTHYKQKCCMNCNNKSHTFFNHHIVLKCKLINREVQKTELCDEYKQETPK